MATQTAPGSFTGMAPAAPPSAPTSAAATSENDGHGSNMGSGKAGAPVIKSVGNLVSNSGTLMAGGQLTQLLRGFGRQNSLRETGYKNLKHTPFMVACDSIVPSCNLRKAVKLFPEKDTGYKRFNFEGGIRVVEIPEGPVISQVTVAAGWRQTVAITDFGRIRARLNAYKRLGFHGVELSPSEAQGVNIGFFTDFDEQKIGNFEVTQKQLSYQRAVPAYIGGPFKGAGATLKLGVSTPSTALKVTPSVGVEDLKVVPSKALLATAVTAAAVFLAVKPPLGFSLGLPLPPKIPVLDLHNLMHLNVKMGAAKEETSGKKKVTVDFSDLASFSWTLPNYEG